MELEKKQTRSLRINIPLTQRERNLILKAAKVVDPNNSGAEYARAVLMRISRKILKNAGVRVKLDLDDHLRGVGRPPGPQVKEIGSDQG